MKVRNLLHTSRDVPWSWGTTGITVCLFFVVIVTQDKAEEKTWHHNISDPQHGEVAACGTGEQLKLGSCPGQKVTSSRLLHFGSELHFAHPFFLVANLYTVEAQCWILKIFSLVISPPPQLSFKHTHFESNAILLQTSLFLPILFKLLLLTHSMKQIHQRSISVFSLLSIDGRYKLTILSNCWTLTDTAPSFPCTWITSNTRQQLHLWTPQIFGLTQTKHIENYSLTRLPEKSKLPSRLRNKIACYLKAKIFLMKTKPN